jgi:chitinase
MVSRFRFVLSSLITIVIGLAICAQAQTNLPKRLIGDYGYWSRTQNPPYSSAQIPFNMLTHINHAGVSFEVTQGIPSLVVPEGFMEPELISKSHAAGVKVLLLLGGDFNGLEQGSETGTAIRNLVDDVAAFETEHGYDGVDIDWEYPETSTDRQLLVELMAKFRESNGGYTLSIDVAPWGGYGYDLLQLQKSLDYFNIMMYDCAGPWTNDGQLNSPIFWDWHDPEPYECQPGGSAQASAEIFLSRVPAEQLTMGTPFYGYQYTNVSELFGVCPNSAWTSDGNCDNTVQTHNYAPAFKALINQNGWHTLRDPIALVPYMLKDDGSPGYITYDDALSTYTRVWYSDWSLGLGGTFMWSLDADYDGKTQDLLTAMFQATLSK